MISLLLWYTNKITVAYFTIHWYRGDQAFFLSQEPEVGAVTWSSVVDWLEWKFILSQHPLVLYIFRTSHDAFSPTLVSPNL